MAITIVGGERTEVLRPVLTTSRHIEIAIDTTVLTIRFGEEKN